MVDVMAATVDVSLRPARQGDGDDGKGLLLGPPEANRYMSLLAFGRRVLGPRTGGRPAHQTRTASWWRHWPTSTRGLSDHGRGRTTSPMPA